MKKLILVFIFLIPFFSFSNNDKVESDTNLSEIIKPYIIKWLEKVDEGAEFIIDETPIVVKQYILFESTIHILIILLGVGFLTYLRISCKKLFYTKSKEKPNSNKTHIDFKYISNNWWLRFDKDDDNEYTTQQIFVLIIDVLFVIIGSIIILVNISDTIKVTFYPKLYLFEKFFYLIS